MAPVDQLIFSLKPFGSRAEKVVSHKNNDKCTSTKWHGTRCFNFGSTFQTKHANKIITIATLGSSRSKADAYISGDDIESIHCTFYINYETGVVVLQDESSGKTRIYQDTESQINTSHREYRRAIVMKGINEMISLGSPDAPARFEIIWSLKPEKILEIVKKRISEASEAKISKDMWNYTDQTQWTNVPNPIKHHPIVELGRGGFGKVMKTVDRYSGGVMAVKLLHRPKDNKDPRWLDTLISARDREVFILSKLKHKHIVNYLGSQGWDTGFVEIFMPMKRGTLADLVRQYPAYDSLKKNGNTVLLQMLSALDYLAYSKLIHRDIKPDNILYDVKIVDGEERIVFQLADFGLSVLQNLGRSQAGTIIFMAPEVYDGEKTQTPRADVWSLYVTMLWVYNEELFRHRVETGRLRGQTEVRRAVLNIASSSKELLFLRSMAIYDPSLRASAAQILTGLNREDLMTHSVAASINSYSEWMADVRAGRSKFTPYLSKILEF
ncbi:kinase-like protein [Daldinia vernicosa]|uniref:kinase-like protein n=1 Tax=Daldinia vernicosa TaxID=114800 RepID=UPI0020072E3E|nr:kinase-like protein [Daldinia vernicosa]KAI0845039.1 kinase-like protein [Daldinia vernicosa]